MPLHQQIGLVAHGVDRKKIRFGNLLEVLDDGLIDVFVEIHAVAPFLLHVCLESGFPFSRSVRHEGGDRQSAVRAAIRRMLDFSLLTR